MQDVADPYITRPDAASLITERCFPVSERQLRKWRHVPLVMIANRVCAKRSEWLQAAEATMREATFGNMEIGRSRAARARAARDVAQSAAKAAASSKRRRQKGKA